MACDCTCGGCRRCGPRIPSDTFAGATASPELVTFEEAVRFDRLDKRVRQKMQRRDCMSIRRGEPPVSTVVPGAKSWPTRPRRR